MSVRLLEMAYAFLSKYMDMVYNGVLLEQFLGEEL
jgi:hypothetical protein